MKLRCISGIFLTLVTLQTSAATRFVKAGNGSAAPPYISWATAAATIQDAVDAADPGDIVLVTNGVYSVGGRPDNYYGNDLTNRVLIDKAVTVQSVNGPTVTTIVGNPVFGTSAVRCVNIGDGAVLNGFTLKNGGTMDYYYWADVFGRWHQQSGAGVTATSGALVTNCIITTCTSYMFGGAASGGLLRNCLLTNNTTANSQGGGAWNSALENCRIVNNSSAAGGGGAEGGALTNCTLFGNSAGGNGGGAEGGLLVNCVVAGNLSQANGGGFASGIANNCTITANKALNSGGGAGACTLNNCILAYNTSISGDNFSGCTLNFSCATPLPDDGTNNFIADPQLLDSGHLKATSPCIATGSPLFSPPTDIDGEARLNPPSIGCDEFSTAGNGSLSVAIQSIYTNAATGFPARFTGIILGHATNVVWNFGDGSFVTNQLSPTHNFAAPGNFSVTVTAFNASNPAGVSAGFAVHVVAQPVFFVKANNATPVPPFNSWATAATNIQDALDAATVPGSLVLVTNGVYQKGGRTAYGSLTNRAAAMIPLDLRSVNGPAVTTISGNPVIGGNAVRCVYLASGAQLTGFTLTNGATLDGGSLTLELNGGAVRCESAYCTVSNCIIRRNSAYAQGGGVEGGTVQNCTLSGNTANSAGAAHGATLSNCTIYRNSANANGGAVTSCTVYNSALFANSCHIAGGAADESTLVNCTVTGNSAGISTGGVHESTVKNSIVFFNTAARYPNWAATVFDNCCTTPLPPDGANNITSDPQLTDGAHITATSPCLAAGNFSFVTGVDIDGESWANPPSSGCDQFQPGAVNPSLAVSILAAYTNVVAGFPVNLSGLILGHSTNCVWNFADGSFATNQLYPTHTWASPGDYLINLTAFNNANPSGVSATVAIHVTSQTIFYVAATNTTPVSPFNSWATAATNIQDAADVAGAGGTILVNDGLYQFGGRVAFGALTNRVALTRPLNLQSLSGPAATIIAGNYVNDDTGVRGVSLVNGCSMTGFTVTNGATRGAGDINLEQSGGGIWCESTNVLVTNCWVTTCAAPQTGGGAFFGTFFNCLFTNNSAGNGGGAYSAILNNSTVNGNYGNGAVKCTLTGCTVNSNSGCGAVSCVLSNSSVIGNSSFAGGGINSCTAFASTLNANSANQGGGAIYSTLINCALSNNVASWSGGGAQACTVSNCTLIANQASFGGGAAFCTLDQCVLSNNLAGNGDGGGAHDCTMTRCTLNANQATGYGGGACVSTLSGCVLNGNMAAEGGGYSGFSASYPALANSLSNCAVFGNSANNGGGIENCVAVNCTITANHAAGSGGGSENSTLQNCIVYHNDAITGPEYDGGSLTYCCTLPLAAGPGNITNEPLLSDSSHISAGSPCRAAGSFAFTSGTDIDGEPWLNPPSIGCDQFNSGSATGALAVAISADFTNCASGFPVQFNASVTGHASSNVWNFGDGNSVSNQLAPSHSFASGGNFTVTFTTFNASNPGGVSASLVIHVTPNPIYYVSLTSTNPVPPFNSWATAATNIQHAADVALPGGTVLVTNGVYRVGGGLVGDGTLSNRVSIVTPAALRSVNGASVTAIEGFPVGDFTAVRCVYLTNGASMSGFTLTNGATRGDAYSEFDYNGAGVWCASARVSISNCVFIANIAAGGGGGGYRGTFNNCTFLNNWSYSGGGAISAALRSCIFSNNSAIYGGGAYGSTLTNCTLVRNYTVHDSDYTENGGGANTCTLANCLLKENQSLRGGGASSCALINCTVIYNSTRGGEGGGVLSCGLTNSIVYFNQAPSGTNYSSDSTFYYCDTSPMPTNGANNISSDPLFADSFHISASSPCRSMGSAAATRGVDIDGDAWLNPPSIGADEFNPASATGPLAVAIFQTFTNVIPGFTIDFTGQVSGHASSNRWNLGDGTIVSNHLALSHNWGAPGNYNVTFTAFNNDNPAGVTASVTIFAQQNPVTYVALANTTPSVPYSSWATAATNVQDAMDVAFAGGTVIVSNGLYQVGGNRVYAGSSNRVAVLKPLTLQSVNGAAYTIIDGSDAVRCLYLTNNVLVSGFTLQNGVGNNGGGVFCEDNDVLENCALIDNSSPNDWSQGGGAFRGVLNHCTLSGNSASFLGAGAAGAGLNFCIISNNGPVAYGGGADGCTLNSCIIVSNTAGWGGGADGSTLNNCLLLGNTVTGAGGGASWSTLNSCTVVSNYAPLSGPGYNAYSGGGIFSGSANNCIVYYNGVVNSAADYGGWTVNHCCITPNPGGPGNITSQPLFVNSAAMDFHLQNNSPCINAGNNASVSGTNDLDNAARIKGGTVDIGAYEFQSPSSLLSYAWAQQFGLPTDGSADFTDPDGDGMNNWQEWIAGTLPNNAASLLKMLTPTNTPSGRTLSWQSASGVNYFLQRRPALTPAAPFATIQTNIPGLAGSTSFTDTNAPAPGPYFYRVGVQQ